MALTPPQCGISSCAWRAGQASQRLPVISLISYKVYAKVQNTFQWFHAEIKVVEIQEETIGFQTGQKIITLTKCVEKIFYGTWDSSHDFFSKN